jgi:hypothetical protein
VKHERFLHIEPRRDDEAPASEAADRARIAAVIDASPPSRKPAEEKLDVAPGASAGDGVPIERADPGQELPDAPLGQGAPELAIDTVAVEGQPFVRCARCGADSTIHATICSNCSAKLDTAEQRAFNEQVWDAQRQRNERERAALAQMAEARAEHMRTSVRPLPEPGILPPPELLEPIHDDGGPIFLEVVRALVQPKWRWIAGGGVFALPLLLVTLGGPLLSKLGWIVLAALFLSLLPRRLLRRLLDARSGGRR